LSNVRSSWGINVSNFKIKHHPASAFLDFGATVWIGGNARLDVEGFRNNGSPSMRAYQYFWHNGRVVGRTRVGTMGFSQYNSWHFQQFAQYRLLNSNKSLVFRSQKVGFCIAPTDPVNLVLPRATWTPSFTGLQGAHNDISLRQVIIGGKAGHRTVRVPALNGIDPER
jgi:hypothetical protein